jgi:hypothetical protein
LTLLALHTSTGIVGTVFLTLPVDADLALGALCVFIHRAITVVVEAVADLFSWTDHPVAVAPHAIVADLLAFGALANARPAGSGLTIGALTPWVDDAVAVVIDPVADLRLRKRRIAVEPCSVLADLLADSALGRAAANEIFVNTTIAVVIETVADLFRDLESDRVESVSKAIVVIDLEVAIVGARGLVARWITAW